MIDSTLLTITLDTDSILTISQESGRYVYRLFAYQTETVSRETYDTFDAAMGAALEQINADMESHRE